MDEVEVVDPFWAPVFRIANLWEYSFDRSAYRYSLPLQIVISTHYSLLTIVFGSPLLYAGASLVISGPLIII